MKPLPMSTASRNRDSLFSRTLAVLTVFCASTIASVSSAANFGDEVAACVVSSGVKSGDPEMQSAMQRCEKKVQSERARSDWHECIYDQVAKLDDGISPASDIALGTQQLCHLQYAVFMQTMTLSAPVKARAEQDRQEITREVATGMVLRYRAAKRANPSLR